MTVLEHIVSSLQAAAAYNKHTAPRPRSSCGRMVSGSGNPWLVGSASGWSAFTSLIPMK